MKVYLVGGAVRDELLELPIKERDFVVVGATEKEMLDNSFQKVGKDFPVFLHPKTNEEYALARTERKTGKGYLGFECFAEPTVTLEEDLKRRDLTINAIAKDDKGELIDPFGGAQDIKDKIIRHVSPAFVEDPLRVLRLARFSARFSNLGFTIAPSTKMLLLEMVRDGELNDLNASRVWMEIEKALGTDSPRVFIEVLRECGALKQLLPEIDRLFGVPATPKWHPEIDTGTHVLMCLDEVTAQTNDLSTRFAVLVHDLGKAITPEHKWPSHHGHDIEGVKVLQELVQRLPVPSDYHALAKAVCRYHIMIHKVEELKATKIADILESLDVIRRPEKIEKVLIACQADANGRLIDNKTYPQRKTWQELADVYRQADIKDITDSNMEGKKIGEKIRMRRISAIKAYLKK